MISICLKWGLDTRSAWADAVCPDVVQSGVWLTRAEHSPLGKVPRGRQELDLRWAVSLSLNGRDESASSNC